jgi:hypothetical protein
MSMIVVVICLYSWAPVILNVSRGMSWRQGGPRQEKCEDVMPVIRRVDGGGGGGGDDVWYDLLPLIDFTFIEGEADG